MSYRRDLETDIICVFTFIKERNFTPLTDYVVVDERCL